MVVVLVVVVDVVDGDVVVVLVDEVVVEVVVDGGGTVVEDVEVGRAVVAIRDSTTSTVEPEAHAAKVEPISTPHTTGNE